MGWRHPVGPHRGDLHCPRPRSRAQAGGTCVDRARRPILTAHGRPTPTGSSLGRPSLAFGRDAARKRAEVR